MRYEHTTQVPNEVLDTCLPVLTVAELKLLLIVIRQTFGWRKARDRISHSQFVEKTGLGKRSVTEAITSLIEKGLVKVTDYTNVVLDAPESRRGKPFLFYSYEDGTNAKNYQNMCKNPQEQVQNSDDNKTILSKLTEQNFVRNQGTTKLTDQERIAQILSKGQEDSRT